MNVSTALFLQTQGAQSDKKISKESINKALTRGADLESTTPTHQKGVENTLSQLM